jgi:hypothetical protein
LGACGLDVGNIGYTFQWFREVEQVFISVRDWLNSLPPTHMYTYYYSASLLWQNKKEIELDCKSIYNQEILFLESPGVYLDSRNSQVETFCPHCNLIKKQQSVFLLVYISKLLSFVVKKEVLMIVCKLHVHPRKLSLPEKVSGCGNLKVTISLTRIAAALCMSYQQSGAKNLLVR